MCQLGWVPKISLCSPPSLPPLFPVFLPHELFVCLHAGACEPSPARWEILCADVKLVILGKLTLRDLARSAPVCREFWTACRSRPAEERAALIAAAVEACGEGVFSAFVKAVQRAMLGLSPCPGLASCNGSRNILIDSLGEARYAGWEDITPGKPVAVITEKRTGAYRFNGYVASGRPSRWGGFPAGTGIYTNGRTIYSNG